MARGWHGAYNKGAKAHATNQIIIRQLTNLPIICNTRPKSRRQRHFQWLCPIYRPPDWV